MRRIATLFFIAASIVASTEAFATTYTVTTLADTTGSCTGASCTTLRAAMTAAASGDTINFTGLSGTISLTSALPPIAQTVTIVGPGASKLEIYGHGSFQIFDISTPYVAVSISGLSIDYGTAAGATGGAIGNIGILTVSDTNFSGNTSGSGGAIYNGGTLTVEGSTFAANNSVGTIYNAAGAIYNTSGDSYHGSPITYGGTLSVVNSTFLGNTTSGSGGAIVNFGTANVTNSTFSGNSAATGGGIVNGKGDTLTVSNNIFVENSTSDSIGAAILNGGGTANADFNLYYQNLASGGTESDCAQCTSNTNAIIGNNPSLLPLGNYGGPMQTMLPKPGSPAICAGTYADVSNGVTTDQRGFPLTNSICSNGGVDVGAVQSDYMPVTTTADSNDGSCTASLCSLRDAIVAANATTYGGDIDFAAGVTGTITLTSALPTLSQSMAIMGPGAAGLTISGDNAYQIFNVGSSSTTYISGLALNNGNAAQTSTGGGAIYSAGNLTVIDNSFSGNTGNSTSGNSCGGAICSVGSLSVTGSTFTGNLSVSGGAIYASGATTIADSTFLDNSAQYGGTVDFYDENFDGLTIINCTFVANSAQFGGALYTYANGTLMVANSTFSANGAGFIGGGIYSDSTATLNLYNNIFTGGISVHGAAGIAQTSAGGNVNANYNLYYQNLDRGALEDDCNGCTTDTNAITGVDPLMAVPDSYAGLTQTMLLRPGSPAICAGSPSLIPNGTTADQRGFARTTNYSGTTCLDLGAVQTNYTAVAFSNPSYSGLINHAVNPAPVVTVTENGQNIGGVPVTLSYSGTGSPTGLGPVTTVGGIGTTFSTLTAPSVAQGTLSVSLPITASTNTLQPAALTASASLTIQSTAQAITFGLTSPVTYGSAPITLAATGGGSGNPVTFSLDTISTPGAATLSGSLLTITGAATIVIDANQAAGNGYVAAAQVQQSILIQPAPLTIAASSPTVTFGSPVPTISPLFGTFYNGDSSAVLTKQPICVTAYTTTSAPGSSPSTSCSGAAAANYIFSYVNGSVTVTPAPTFALGGATGSISITPGVTTGNTVAITITPANGFTGTVNLSCAISPAGASSPPTCSLAPNSVTISGSGSQASILTITTTAATAVNDLKKLLWPSTGTALALVLMIAVPQRRHSWPVVLCVLALSLTSGVIGCGSSGKSQTNSGNPGTTPGTYTVTVTGTSGSVTSTAATFTLTVQ